MQNDNMKKSRIESATLSYMHIHSDGKMIEKWRIHPGIQSQDIHGNMIVTIEILLINIPLHHTFKFYHRAMQTVDTFGVA